MIPVISKNNLLCYLIDTSKFEYMNEMKKILVGFAEKIDIINMNNIPMRPVSYTHLDVYKRQEVDLIRSSNNLSLVEYLKKIEYITCRLYTSRCV